MSVVGHVNKDRLLSSPAGAFDARNAHMVSGRAIHFFFQFVEPILRRRYPDALREARATMTFETAAMAGSLSPWHLARTRLAQKVLGELDSLQLAFVPAEDVARLRVGAAELELCRFEVTGGVLTSGATDLVDSVKSGYELLQKVALGYFVDLGLGIAARTDEPAPAALCSVPQVAILNADDLVADWACALELVRQGAEGFAWLWLEAEYFLTCPSLEARHEPSWSRLVRYFGALVSCELLRRIELTSGRGPWSPLHERLLARLCKDQPELLAWLDTFEAAPLTQELVGCWYPGWIRSLLIYDSPFDHDPVLRAVPIKDDLEAPRGFPGADRVGGAHRPVRFASATEELAPAQGLEKTQRFPFIALEGCDGVGKSSIRVHLSRLLGELGLEPMIVGQHSWLNPYVSRLIIHVREEMSKFDHELIAGAYFADKRLHARYNVLPSLASVPVVADRYVISDAVYQEVLYGIPAEEVLERHRQEGTLFPTVVLLVDVDSEEAYRRIIRRQKRTRHYERPAEMRRIIETYERVLVSERLDWLPPVMQAPPGSATS